MLKAIIDKLDDVVEAARQFYVEKNGKFELQVEGFKTQGDVDRITTSLTKERADHVKTRTELTAAKDGLAKFEGLDPDEVHTKLGEYDVLKETAAGKPDAAKIAQLVEQGVAAKVKQAVTPLQRQLEQAQTQAKTFETENGSLKTNITQRTIDDVVRNEALAAKANPAAIGDFLALARTEFVIGEDGKVTTKDGLDPKTFVADQKASRPWLWPAAQGAGAGGSGNPNINGGKNPFARATWNLTEQGNLLKTDAAAADRLAAAAGTKVGGGMPPEAPKA